jgi:hypothetical protein
VQDLEHITTLDKTALEWFPQGVPDPLAVAIEEADPVVSGR